MVGPRRGGEPPPESANELKCQLQDMLSVNEQKKISASVIDVSKPSR